MYGINSIGLRFFTVYGSWGRPDMSIFNLQKYFERKTIEIYNYGNHIRDFTHVMILLMVFMGYHCIRNKPGYKIFNIGNNKTGTVLMKMLGILEKSLRKKRLKSNTNPCSLGTSSSTKSSTRKFI